MPEPQSRFAFPDQDKFNLCEAILALMQDGKRRSIMEIQDALGTRREVSARIRQLRKDGHDFTDARSSGPDEDGVFRYELRKS